jgi:hypothetical protein
MCGAAPEVIRSDYPRLLVLRCGITLRDFHIEIVKQGWITSDDLDYDAATLDLCTHGDLRLTIGGQTIASGDGHDQYGISEAALGLLRTLESDTSEAPDQPFADRLIPHGCGAILMMGCPIGIDWTVRHLNGRVRITDVIRYDSTDEAEALRFPGLTVELLFVEYRDEIAAFARRAKQPFEGIEKSFSDDVDRQDFINFWEEYDRLLDQAVQSPTGSPRLP